MLADCFLGPSARVVWLRKLAAFQSIAAVAFLILGQSPGRQTGMERNVLIKNLFTDALRSSIECNTLKVRGNFHELSRFV